MNQKERRLIWAIDSTAKDLSIQGKILPLLRCVGRISPLRIEPVHIVFPEEAWKLQSQSKPRINDLPAPIDARVMDWLAGAKLPGVCPPTVLACPKSSLRSGATALLTYAVGQGADYLAVTTRARRGLDRFLFGSFAETLILKSEVPLLIVNPSVRPKERVRHVLFPCDLQGDGAAAYGTILDFVEGAGARLTVLHLSQFLYDNPGAAFGPADAFAEAEEKDSQQRTQRLDEMVQLARSRGVEAEAVLLHESPKGVAETVLDFAKKSQTDLIAMLSRKEGSEPYFVGSVTRQVIRRADCPVWVRHC